MTPKILPVHLSRTAYVYLRQSTPGQVRENVESTARQYALADRAKGLGWQADQVKVLDGDLGKSGKTAEGRDDFHRLCAAVGLGEVGAVFALEASRLSRSQADWHRLLDLCAWTHTLMIDHDGIYDPNDFNDRVLLGFKGTFSHTELHAMRMRLHGARRSKARRGEYRSRPPTGYVHDEGGLALDPDEGVVAAVRQVFTLFRSLGSAYAVARHFAARGLRFPARTWLGGNAFGPLEWRVLQAGRVLQILQSPVYTGAYTYGRRPLRPVVQDGKLVGARSVLLPRAEWEVDLPDAHPAYVTHEEYKENQRLLTMNRTVVETGARQGRPRGGSALLQGLVLCGRCGRRMQVKYRAEVGGTSVYVCPQRGVDIKPSGNAMCWSTPGAQIDTAVEHHVLAQLTEDNLDLSLEVLHQLQSDAGEAEHQWQLRLERARQDAGRAERQYQLVEPENRLVGRTLERRWEEKLAELADVQARYDEEHRQPRLTLSAEERERILSLAQDLPAVWQSATTTQEDRKELLGLLIQQVALVPEDLPRRQTRVRILWHTGATTEVLVDRPENHDLFRTPPDCIQIIRELMPTHTDAQIAAELTERRLLTGRRKPWTALAVCTARHQHDLTRYKRKDRGSQCRQMRADGRYPTRAVAALLGVDRSTVLYWCQTGLLPGVRDPDSGTWWFHLPPELAEKLRNRPRIDRRRRQPAPVSPRVQDEVQCE